MKKQKMANQNFAKRGIITIIFAVVVVVALILANIFVIKIAEKRSTIIDLTSENSNSLTPSNIEFIKKVDYPVEIIVCVPNRAEYTGSKMVSYVYNVYYVQTDATPDNYFNQTINLLEAYTKCNENLTLRYVDPQKPEFEKLESEFDVDITYGDIIVRCQRKNEEGKLTTYNEVLTFEEIYELYDPSNGSSMTGYPTYVIAASNIETALSSAIYTVASSNKSKIGVLSDHSTVGAWDTFSSYLDGYNFEVVNLDGTLSLERLEKEDIETVMLVSPISDLSNDEIGVLDKFLNNNGNRGKNFVVFGSASSPQTPKLNEFLEEWGIVVKDKISYETNGSYKLSDGISIRLFDKQNELTAEIKDTEDSFYCSNNIALETKYDKKGIRSTHVLMTTSAYAVQAPKGVDEYKETEDDVLGEIPTIIVTEETDYDADYNEISSYVGYFASTDFIAASWKDFSGNGNLHYATVIMSIINGRDGANVYYDPKITGLYSMTNPFTEAQYNAVYICSIIVIPVLLLIGGVLVWFRRRNR